ncbi:cytochrome-c oxidase, cbb3-type subunit I [Vulgatibacter incomptus]|uniref:cytochrome-c oxidase n=1 Tax=Vulgatibacter incomptus TaxID=1391653 RepID=A0A0K1PIP6_9BACT|nr:cytochrome-c oxidase, cbb3-type subunit I [Vulgatibacter incomptus]AKU92984.1 Cytochrome c oxidase subunit CcoN [Vulgatibacter incomptus]
MEERHIVYNDGVVRQFTWAAILWGIVGMAVGALVATQLAWWQANFDIPWLTFSRLRPLHTNAVIFAFVGNMMFAGIYYSTQRLVKARLASDLLSRIHFWGWQAIIVAAAITLPLGYSQSKEYAELEWPIDIAIAVVWVIFAINFFWTLAKRTEKNLYVAIWFYIATIVTVAVLHIVNNLALPLGALKSYSIFGGVQDALVQWWYGHNAVAFFLTTPILGIMYYFLPKAAGRPVYSYRLSIVHFWALVFVYIWAGPHHLLYTSLPDWAQSLGMVFSVMLWAPSWGGMLNGLLTLRGAWDKLRTDPVIKFLIAGVTFYGMATFEGPLLSIKSVSALGHYTDWIIGHVHGAALGWNGFMAAGMFYWLVPRLYGTKLHSTRAADAHFWIGTAGILLYVVAMWVSGISQGLMWRAFNPDGTLLYPDFVETLLAIRPLYIVRLVGGSLYLGGFVLMGWNLVMTARAGAAVNGEAKVVVETRPAPPVSSWGLVASRPVFYVVGLFALAVVFALGNVFVAVAALAGIAVVGLFALFSRRDPSSPGWHGLLEGRSLLFTVLTLVAILIGGVAEILPTVLVEDSVPRNGTARPYTPLELAGRDIYVKEGCYNCHSQQIRPFRSEKLRYGDPSTIDESIYDHPFQWGSKRTGPDLARVGGKYPNLWHYTHMLDPRATSPGSNMPNYPWLAVRPVPVREAPDKLRVMQRLGVPYTDQDVDLAETRYREQAEAISADLAKSGVDLQWDRELTAVIAYLQRLGKTPPAPAQGKDLTATKEVQ